MTLHKINPDTLVRPHGFAQVTVATGSKIVFTAGQVGVDVDGKVVGTDYRSQARQAGANVYAAVVAAGGSAADVARLTVYVVDATDADLEELYIGLGEAGQAAGAKTAAMTLLGVTRLSDPSWLLEIDATAVLD